MARPLWTGLDGLRASAVVSVVVFHASLGWAVNGYVGVDVFFALSGFLITWLLLVERQRTGRVSLPYFYARRALRLFPALAVTLLGVTLLSVASDEPSVVLRGVVASLLYIPNWWMFSGHDMPLLEHTWTLAIEEHFYLVWPVLVLLAGIRTRRSRQVLLALGVAIVLLLALPWPDGVVLVKGTYLRGASIVLGSLLAILMYFRPVGEHIARLLGPAGLLSFAGLVAIMFTSVTLPVQWMSGLLSVPAWLSLVVVASCVAAPQATIVRALSVQSLVWVGRRSYGIYLYHYPILSLLMHKVDLPMSHGAEMLLGTVLTLVVVELSYRFLELPVLRLKKRFTPDADVSVRPVNQDLATKVR